MSATVKNASFVCQLDEPARNHEHTPDYKADVLKWRVRAPGTPCVGIFINPETECLEEVVAKPRSPVSSGPCRPIASTIRNVGLSPFPQENVPVFVNDSGQGHANAMEYCLERRQLPVTQDVEGQIHTVDIGTSYEDPSDSDEVRFSSLVIDTGALKPFNLDFF
ncbi:hypothetical protein B0H14DRAFT_3872231 [Mycena olivaceomarginata]|nr:hypothetical protein B0H14DRAFT_3872231 [Mycena olivaceomarginata]